MVYNFEIKHREGRKLQNADCLSRFQHHDSVMNDPCLHEPNDDIVISAMKSVGKGQEILKELGEVSLGSVMAPDKITELQLTKYRNQ